VLLARQLERVGSALHAAQAASRLAPWLQTYAWPGNVRELENLCERIAVYLADFSALETVDWGGLLDECPELNVDIPVDPGHPAPRLQSPRGRAVAALARHGGSRHAAAQQLGISRSTLWRWLNAEDAQAPLESQAP